MGETISYSSGEEEPMNNTDRLAQELGFHLERRANVWVVVDSSGVSPATYISEKLWRALEEREREVERLREVADAVSSLAPQYMPTGSHYFLPPRVVDMARATMAASEAGREEGDG